MSIYLEMFLFNDRICFLEMSFCFVCFFSYTLVGNNDLIYHRRTQLGFLFINLLYTFHVTIFVFTDDLYIEEFN